MTQPPEEPTAAGTPDAPDALRRGMSMIAGEEFSFAEAIGGVRGLVEAILPGLVFVVVFLVARTLTDDALTIALIASAGLAVLATLARLVQGTPVTQAVSGLLGVGIAVVWAWRTGEAQDYFAWGLLVNLGFLLGSLATIVARWPFVGVVMSLARGEDFSWRTERTVAAAQLRRRYRWATWGWVGLFGARLAVQVPLYLAGEESVGWLGSAKLAMGVPLTAVVLWVNWLLVRAPADRAEPADPRPGP